MREQTAVVFLPKDAKVCGQKSLKRREINSQTIIKLTSTSFKCSGGGG